MSTLDTKPQAVLTRLSIMMFLQFFAWGAWFATLALAMGSNDLGDYIGGAYESAPIAAIFAPLFLGLIADRLFPSEKVMGVLMVIGGGIMCGVAVLAPQGAEKGGLIVWLMIAYMMCYMPTLGLANTITFTHLPQELFPKARVWGTIGWIVAGLGLGAVGWSASLNIFWLGAISSLLLGIYSFTLPSTPPPAKGKPLDIGSLLMFDAFKLLKSPPFFVFAICSFLICIPLAYYYGQTSAYLGAAGFTEAGAAMTLGQMSEIGFMLLIPFFFRKLGVKLMLLIGMGCWVLRYALFAMGAPDQIMWMLLMGIALHGICYDFFFVTGFIYTDKKAPAAIRGQAQSLLVFLTQGLGMFVGFRMAFGGNVPFTAWLSEQSWASSIIKEPIKIPNSLGEIGVTGDMADIGAAPANHQPLIDNIAQLKGEQEAPTFVETMTGMFGKGYPEGVDPTLRDAAMNDWMNYWYFPAGMAAVILVVFAVFFWDKVKTDDIDIEDAAEALPEDAPA
ncbi:MAG: MFS transporter [Phycisphaeraceae bacterium]